MLPFAGAGLASLGSAESIEELRDELVQKSARIEQLEARVRSLQYPEAFGNEPYPPLQPEWFGQN